MNFNPLKDSSSLKDFRINVYLAGPLFSVQERAFNCMLEEKIRSECDVRVFLPQRDGVLVGDCLSDDSVISAAFTEVFRRDIKAIGECDLVVAVLDGATIDTGAAFEIGYAYHAGKVCIGLQTDFRRSVFGRNNPMVDGALADIAGSIDELVDLVKAFVRERRGDLGVEIS